MSDTNANTELDFEDQTDDQHTSADSDTDSERTPTHVNGSGGDADIVGLDTGTIQRGPNGEPIPRREYVEELGGDVVVKPLPAADRERYIENTIGSGEDLSDADLAELFEKYIVDPDFTNHPACPDDHVSEEFVRESLTGAQEDAYFFAILLGADEHALVERLRTTRRGGMDEDQMQLLKELGPEKMQELTNQINAGDGGGQGRGN